MIALIWEVWNDRHGDLDKSFDVLIRAILIVVESVTIHLIFNKPIIDCLLLSTAIFFMFFDYLVTYVLIKNKVIEPRVKSRFSWFKVTGKQGWFDNFKLWSFASPWVRFGIKLVFLTVAIILFIK